MESKLMREKISSQSKMNYLIGNVKSLRLENAMKIKET